MCLKREIILKLPANTDMQPELQDILWISIISIALKALRFQVQIKR